MSPRSSSSGAGRGGFSQKDRPLPAERAVTIYLNEHEVTTLQATPEYLDELAVGFLHNEGLVADRRAVENIEVDRKKGLVWVSSPTAKDEDLYLRRRYVTAGCGQGMTFISVGHAKDISPIPPGDFIPTDELLGFMQDLERASVLHRTSGGVHACGFARPGHHALLVAREDIGRHNAVDKVLGRLMLDGIPTDGGILLTTGRISYEMVVKTAKAQVPVALSRTAVTDLAAEIADDLGVCLVAYVRGQRFRVVTHPERILMRKKP